MKNKNPKDRQLQNKEVKALEDDELVQVAGGNGTTYETIICPICHQEVSVSIKKCPFCHYPISDNASFGQDTRSW